MKSILCSVAGVFVLGWMTHSVEASTQKPVFLTTPESWSQALGSLFNGLYDDGERKDRRLSRDFFGSLQGGPYYQLKDGNQDTIFLTTIERDTCFKLEKPLSQLKRPDLPTRFRKLDCFDGKKIRDEAQVPWMGMNPLSRTGASVLREIEGVDWVLARPCYLNGSKENSKEFLQTFKFQFQEEFKEMDIWSYASAFSTRHTGVIPEFRLNPIQVRRLAETVSPEGIYRFVVWGDKVAYSTDRQNAMEIAVVNPELINSSRPLMLEGGKKICMGDSCRETRDVEFTRYVKFRYLILTVDPKNPNWLGVNLLLADSQQPAIQFHYLRR